MHFRTFRNIFGFHQKVKICKYFDIYQVPSDTTCICSKFGHQMAPLALVPNLAIRWRHLQMLLIWPPGCVTLLPWDALLMMPIIDDALLASSVREATRNQFSCFLAVQNSSIGDLVPWSGTTNNQSLHNITE